MQTQVLIPVSPDDLRTMIDTSVSNAVKVAMLEATPIHTPKKSSASPYMTRKEVIELLRIASPTLRAMELDGRLLPAKRIGRKVLFLRADVEDYLLKK